MRAMKDSGIEWIGQIPEEWETNMVFQVFRQVKHKNYDLSEQNLLSLSYGNIKRKDIDSNEGLLPESFAGYNVIDNGDIVLRLTDLQNDHKSLRVGLVKERGIITSAYITLRNTSENLSQYMYRYLHSFDVAKGFYGMGDGVRQGLTWEGIKKLKVLVPPLAEQRRIASYLDSKCSKIDSIVAKQQQLIEKLKAYKQAVITEAITKGLNPDVPMKDSGIEWIGEIPEGWKCCKQKYVMQFINGRAYKEEEFQGDGKYKVLRVGNLYTNPNWYYSDLELDKDKYCDNGDLIYTWSMSYGPIIWTGDKVIYHYHIWKVNLTDSVDKRYVYYYLTALTNALQASLHETTMSFLTMGIMNNSYIAYGPIEEQRDIANYLDLVLRNINQSISRRQQLITKLQEYKKSLIYEVVTGKREVPNV